MKIWRTSLVIVTSGIGLGVGGSLDAAPAQIIFLRHAEKPDVGAELNERGRERAAALVKLFTQDTRVLEHGPAAAIFAMRPHAKKGSVRAIQTMEPTARALGISSDTRLTRDEFAPLVRAVMSSTAFDGKTVIVCWEHDAIPELMKAFGWKDGPTSWSGKSYDRLWVLDFEKEKPVRYRDLPQTLLPGDKSK